MYVCIYRSICVDIISMHACIAPVFIHVYIDISERMCRYARKFIFLYITNNHYDLQSGNECMRVIHIFSSGASHSLKMQHSFLLWLLICIYIMDGFYRLAQQSSRFIIKCGFLLVLLAFLDLNVSIAGFMGTYAFIYISF